MKTLAEFLKALFDAETHEQATSALEAIEAAIPDLSVDDAAVAEKALRERVVELTAGVKESENPTADVAAAKAIKSVRDKVEAHAATLSEAREEVFAEAAALAEGLTVDEPKTAVETEVEPVEVETPEDPKPEPVEAVTPVEPVKELEPVAASADTKRVPLGKISKRQPVLPQPDQGAQVLTAAAGVDRQRVGSEFRTTRELGEALAKSADGLGAGGKATVATASFATQMPYVAPGNGPGNWMVMDKVRKDAIRGEAITAAGGFCAPGQPIYDFFSVSASDGLLNLPSIVSERGALEYPVSPGVADLLSQEGIGNQHSNADDIAATAKPLYTPACVETLSCEIDGYSTRLQFGNFAAKFYPEFVAHLTSESMITHDNKVDIALLAAIDGLATDVDAAGALVGGTWVTVTQTLLWYAAWYRGKWRTSTTLPIDVLLPAYVRDALVADWIARNGTNEPNVGFGAVDRFFELANLRPQWLQNLNPIEDIVGADRFPAADVYLFAPGTIVRQTAAELDLGVVRDTTTNAGNNFQTFVETFDGICFPGNELVKVTGIPICPTGGTGEQVSIVCPSTS